MDSAPAKSSTSRPWAVVRGAVTWGLWLVLALLVAPMATGRAQAQSSAGEALEAGRSAYLEAEFEGAVAHFGRTLNQPDASPTELGEAHLYLAALHSMLGAPERAAQHARLAVALRPDATSPEGAPEELDALLDAARAETEAAPLSVALETDGELHVGTAGRISARLSPAEMPFVSTLRVRCQGPEAPSEAEGPAPLISLDLTPTAGAWRCRGAALTEGGAELAFDERSWTFETEAGGMDEGLLIGLVAGGGAALVVASVIVIAVLASSGTSEQAELGPPTIEGW